MIRVDPAVQNAGVKLDAECFSPIESTDKIIFSYLVRREQGFMRKNNSRTLKSWWLTNGWHVVLLSVHKDVLSQESLLCWAKWNTLKRMNDLAISTWIIASKESTVLSAHCMDCKADLAESCSHVASILFYIEAWARIHEKSSCTQVRCSWLLQEGMKDVPYSRVRDINFESASALKARLRGQENRLPDCQWKLHMISFSV